MARARPALQQAVNEILIRHGNNGKRLSYRQAERLTGLSPATVGELAKGNARTPETVRRFAIGLGEDVERLLLLAGFVPADLPASPILPQKASIADSGAETDLEPDDREWLNRYGCALAKLPQGPVRDLWKARLYQDVALLETFLELLTET